LWSNHITLCDDIGGEFCEELTLLPFRLIRSKAILLFFDITVSVFAKPCPEFPELSLRYLGRSAYTNNFTD